MSAGSTIEWTDATWNPLVGCSRVSAGCEHCYAERFMHRGLHHKGLTRSTSRGPVWTGEVRLVEKALDLPLRWRKPRRVFVNSLSDLFHESVPDEWIDRVFAVMALAPRHTFQVLTKRADRMRSYVLGMIDPDRWDAARKPLYDAARRAGKLRLAEYIGVIGAHARWPIPNVHLGVSCENQEAFDDRVRHLVQTPAALRFVSAEPLLSPLDIDTRRLFSQEEAFAPPPSLDWVIVGGESGPGARPCDVAWIRDVVRQCREGAVPCFVKQLGAKPIAHSDTMGCAIDLSKVRTFLRDRKGGNPEEWPPDLRVRALPDTTSRAARAQGGK